VAGCRIMCFSLYLMEAQWIQLTSFQASSLRVANPSMGQGGSSQALAIQGLS
jgi:hypothetical protein